MREVIDDLSRVFYTALNDTVWCFRAIRISVLLIIRKIKRFSLSEEDLKVLAIALIYMIILFL